MASHPGAHALVVAPGRAGGQSGIGSVALEKAPNKTFIGRIEKGFDFLGYHVSPEGLTATQHTVERFVARATRLGDYVSRWVKWVRGNLSQADDPRQMYWTGERLPRPGRGTSGRCFSLNPFSGRRLHVW